MDVILPEATGAIEMLLYYNTTRLYFSARCDLPRAWRVIIHSFLIYCIHLFFYRSTKKSPACERFCDVFKTIDQPYMHLTGTWQCGNGFTCMSEACYKAEWNQKYISWIDSNKFCATHGGRLAMIRSLEEALFLLSWFVGIESLRPDGNTAYIGES
jgi:hypothetical protein